MKIMNRIRSYTSHLSKVFFKNVIMKVRHLALLNLPIIVFWILLPAGADAQDHYPAESWMRYATPEEAGWSSNGIEQAKEFADSIGTAAFMLIHDGVVVTTFGDYSRRYWAHSVRKSLLSGLYGVYVAEGHIDLENTLADLSIDDRLQLTPKEKQARVIDLLKSRSGVYHPAAYETSGMAASRPERGSHEPGTFWYYNNWDFNTLGEIFQQRTGLGVFDAFERRISDPLRMEDFRLRDGYYHLEPQHSNHPAYPFRMSARDMARFGLLFERDGRWEGEQIIPASWIRESTRPYSEIDLPGVAGYGYMWWLLGGELGQHGAYTALGVGDQAITIIPDLELVFVHRVNTYADNRVSLQDVIELLEQLIDSKIEAGHSDPALVRLENPAPSGFVRLSDELLQRYARTYTFPSGRTVEVSLQDGQLVSHNEQLGTYSLLPLTDRQFLIEDAGMTVYFGPLNDSDSTMFIQEMILRSEASILLNQGRAEEAVHILENAVTYYPASAEAHHALGRAQLAHADTTAAIANYLRSFELNPDNSAAEFDLVRLGVEGFETTQPKPEVLEVYVGRYRFPDGNTFTLSIDGGRLLLSPPDAPQGAPVSIPLIATSDTVFFIDGGPKLTFTPTESGRIRGVRFFLPDGQEFWVDKIEDH